MTRFSGKFHNSVLADSHNLCRVLWYVHTVRDLTFAIFRLVLKTTYRPSRMHNADYFTEWSNINSKKISHQHIPCTSCDCSTRCPIKSRHVTSIVVGNYKGREVTPTLYGVITCSTKTS